MKTESPDEGRAGSRVSAEERGVGKTEGARQKWVWSAKNLDARPGRSWRLALGNGGPPGEAPAFESFLPRKAVSRRGSEPLSDFIDEETVDGEVRRLLLRKDSSRSVRSQILVSSEGEIQRFRFCLSDVEGRMGADRKVLSVTCRPLPIGPAGTEPAGRDDSDRGSRQFCEHMINSLQVLESLHALYCDRRMKSAPEDISRNLILKLQAMGHVYRDALGRNGVGRVRMTECLAKMLNDVSEMFGPLPLEVAVRGDEILLSIPEAINCGIIASEVMHNAISHGFPPGFAGKMVIRVEVRKGRDGGIEISIDDNGVGLEGKDPEADDDAIGWTLIRTLANQLGGVVGFSSSPRGMSMTLRFPEKGPSIRT